MDSSDDVVLVQCVEDYYYFGLFAEIGLALKLSANVNVQQLVVRCLRPGSSQSFKSFVFSLLFTNWFTDNKWVRLYSSFCERVAYRNTAFGLSIRDIFNIGKAFSIWKMLRGKDDVLRLTIDDVLIGDLVYDSYLRFKPAPTVDVRDLYLLVIIWQSLRNIRLARVYFSRVRPKLFITSYSSYIQHGIPVRVALMYEIPVFSLGNYQELLKKLSLNDWFHVRSHDSYRQNWLALDAQEDKLGLADANLQRRLSGG